MAESAARKAIGRKKSGADFNLAGSPAHLLRRVLQYTFDIYTQEVGVNGITPRQFAVLLTVDQNEGLSQTDLVRLTGIDRSTLADMISRLLKRDLLARKRTESDQRANAVRITANGRKALKTALPHVARADLRILDALPTGKRNEFMKALAVISAYAEESAVEQNGSGQLKATASSRGRKAKASKRN